MALAKRIAALGTRMSKNFSSRVAAHAPTKYQSNVISGRGARVSYRDFHPEVAFACFRYLSPGREGEKCRPLDHTSPQLDNDRYQFLNMKQHSSYFLHVVRSIACVRYLLKPF